MPPEAEFDATPTSGEASLTVFFNATESSDPEGSSLDYHWNFGDGAEESGGPLTDHTYTSADQYLVTLTVTDPLGASDQSSVVINVTGSGSEGGDPEGCSGSWATETIGSVGTSQVSGSYTITSSGGIFGNSDDFTFLYQECTGDIDIEVEVASISGPNAWGKGGVMVRESLSASAKNAFGIITTAADHRVGMQWRSAAGGSTGQNWSLNRHCKFLAGYG